MSYEAVKPDGISSRAEWTRLIDEAVFKRLKIQGGPGVKIHKTSNGILVEVDQNVIKAAAQNSGARWA